MDAPPPAYTLYDAPQPYTAYAGPQRIVRKAVSSPALNQGHDVSYNNAPPLPQRPHGLPPPPPILSRHLTSFADHSKTGQGAEYPPPPESSNSHTSSVNTSRPTTASLASKAFKEARHFAGGLVHHPSESNKHFSILRHSHGLVFYQGTDTTLAISIFADAPLPSDRTIWMQCKGYSGKTGMRLKTLLGADGSWLNVTPSRQVSTEQLRSSDERAWQRDIASFIKRSDTRVRDTHRLRETAIVHIPAEAEDGYFRLVLCTGENKKVLCPSPVFRFLSTSTSPGMLRGASLTTLPFEVAAKIGAKAANKAIDVASAPYQPAIQTGLKVYQVAGRASSAVDVHVARKEHLEDSRGQIWRDEDERERKPSYLERVKTGVAETKSVAQGHLQKAGIRIQVAEVGDDSSGTGGMFVVR